MILILAKPRTHNKNAAAVGSMLNVTKIIDIKKSKNVKYHILSTRTK